jgi:hypothetical protein
VEGYNRFPVTSGLLRASEQLSVLVLEKCQGAAFCRTSIKGRQYKFHSLEQDLSHTPVCQFLILYSKIMVPVLGFGGYS